MSQSTQNALNRIEMQKKNFLPLLTHVAQNSRKFKKKSVSQLTRNSLKRIEMQKNFFTPLTDYALSRVAQSASGEAQPYLPHVTRRVPRSVNAKFHADWTKTVGSRGIQTNKQTNKQTDRQSYFNNIDGR